MKERVYAGSMTAEGTINYEALAQEAMRGLVRAVLTRTAKTGLPGEHHFYISFDTQMPGVSLSRRLREKYPEEMTIVLQHRFWDLSVTEDRFEVKLTFDGIPERLVVPFGSIKVFFDPSVRYGLQFDDADAGQDGTAAAEAPQSVLLDSTRPIDRITPGRATSAHLGSQGAERVPGQGAPQGSGPTPGNALGAPRKRPQRKPRTERIEAAADAESGDGAETTAVERASDKGAKPEAPASGAQIVSLSDFRKK